MVDKLREFLMWWMIGLFQVALYVAMEECECMQSDVGMVAVSMMLSGNCMYVDDEAVKVVR